MGSRVRKEVFTYDNGWPANPDKREHFVYDGWNVVMVIDANASDVNATSAILRKYTWGLDLSSSIHGAGGIGGLLACEEPQAVGDPKRYWFLYDANGNVGQVLDATSLLTIGVTAKYEYDPYGNLVYSWSTGNGNANPFRFSTKWFDAETGLYYYGYRYYSPRLGRWLSRDPMGERGGMHLFAYASNSPTVLIDPWGNEAVSLITIGGAIYAGIDALLNVWQIASWAADGILKGSPWGIGGEEPYKLKIERNVAGIVNNVLKERPTAETLIFSARFRLYDKDTLFDNDDLLMSESATVAWQRYDKPVLPLPGNPPPTANPIPTTMGAAIGFTLRCEDEGILGCVETGKSVSDPWPCEAVEIYLDVSMTIIAVILRENWPEPVNDRFMVWEHTYHLGDIRCQLMAR